MSSGILLLDCPDRRGIVAAIADFLYAHGTNILHADQHQDNEAGMFFMRVEWSLDGFDLNEKAFQERFGAIAREFRMRWTVAGSVERPRIAIFVSRYQDCLLDLLHRNQIGGMAGEIAMIVSNHQDAESLASFYKLPFHFFATTSDNKMEIEQCESDWFRQNKCRSDHSGALHADLVIPLCGALPAENHQCAPFVSYPPLPGQNRTMLRLTAG